jgi:very-short-patch-repair endonuclease
MSQKKTITKEVLVALLPKVSALDRLKSESWYHIPVEKAPKRWPPKVLAFYQGKVFGVEEAYKIRYSGEIAQIDIVPRKELFPDDEKNLYKAEKLYYRLQVGKLVERKRTIVSYRPRRLVFIPTTWEKFQLAEQINDLFDGSELEERFWIELKNTNILAERQWKLKILAHAYYLDFAVFCNNGKLAVETDGYTTHYESILQIDYDTWRHNEIEIDDWRFLHYTSTQVNDNKTPYIAQIRQEIEQLGGLESPEDFSRKIGEEQAEYMVDDDEDID